MRKGHWTHLIGSDMALVNERGIITGVLHPLDEQIVVKIRKSLVSENRRSEAYARNKEVMVV